MIVQNVSPNHCLVKSSAERDERAVKTQTQNSAKVSAGKKRRMFHDEFEGGPSLMGPIPGLLGRELLAFWFVEGASVVSFSTSSMEDCSRNEIFLSVFDNPETAGLQYGLSFVMTCFWSSS